MTDIKKEFDEKFFNELYDYMNDLQTDSEFREMLWRWIEQYAEDMCKEQRGLSVDIYCKDNWKKNIVELLDNAPLATKGEEK